MLAPALVDYLRARRAACNERFAAARRRWPRLDGDDFPHFLRDQLAPLATALALHAPDRLVPALDGAYELGLRLVGEKLAGPSATTPILNTLWRSTLPQLAPQIAGAPRRMLASLSNAAHRLGATPHTRLDEWRARLEALASRCSHHEELLATAQILAWRAGLAHYRPSALAAAASLPPELALEVLSAPPGSRLGDVLYRHEKDPWFGYDHRSRPIPASLLSRRVGAFRGFGGLFVEPPVVTITGQDFLVRSAEDAWILVADAFGATFHRATNDELGHARSVEGDSSAGAGLPRGHRILSHATLGRTLAMTSVHSHSVWIGPLADA